MGHDVAAPGPGGTPNQTFDHPTKPHAVSSSTKTGLTYAYDADGNLLWEWDGATAPRHFSFDSSNQLTCVGNASGSCNQLATHYDVSGGRIHDSFPSGSGTGARLYVDQLFELYLPHIEEGGPDPQGRSFIFAFGERIAVHTTAPPTLRTAALWPGGFAPITVAPELLPALLLLLLLGASLVGASVVLVVGTGAAPTGWPRPAGALLATTLAVLLVVPPMPARGGGIPTTIVTTWLIGDALGTVSVEILADGELVAQTRHTPFGGVDAQSGAMAMGQTFGGHRQESETGLYYMQARWMNADTGTFLSVDPLVMPSDPQLGNAYSYARNNPISANDPDGRCVTPFACGAWTTTFNGSGARSTLTTTTETTWTYADGSTETSTHTSENTIEYSEINGYGSGSSSSSSGFGATTSSKSEEGEWIYPYGESTSVNDYDTVITNGVNTSRDSFVRTVNERGVPGFYNPTNGLLADVLESAGQKFGGPSPLAASFLAGLKGVDHAMTIIAHSQGTLTVANASLSGQLPAGSHIIFRSPAISYARAAFSAGRSGATFQYIQPYGDAAALWAPSWNPVKLLLAPTDFFRGFAVHAGNGL